MFSKIKLKHVAGIVGLILGFVFGCMHPKAQAPVKVSQIRVLITMGTDLMVFECDSTDEKNCSSGSAVHAITFIGKWKPKIVMDNQCQINCK